MDVALISADESLARLCREALDSLPSRRWNLLVVPGGKALPPADLFIWDSGTQIPTPDVLEEHGAQAHMFVVSRNEAAGILDALPLPGVTLVLKPVQSDTLRTFLEQAANVRDSLGGARGDPSLRQDRDALLDCLLATSLRLQEHDQDRMNFLARAVHDFRTPLTAVNGYCGLLLSEQLGPLSATQ
jgi:signal transduction histidine kinase